MVAPSFKKRKTNQRSGIGKYWWLPLVLAGVTMIGLIATGPRWSRVQIDLPSMDRPIAGYTAGTPAMLQEYLRFYGKPLNNAEIERLSNQADERVAAKDYSSAVAFLEQVAKVAAVPAVFNNLGVLYAEVKDRSRSINAFREALARDIDYQPVRTNLGRLNDIMALGAEPVSREVEPNDIPALANIIAPGKPVEGEVATAVNDIDFFRVTMPPAPRDLISIEIENHSTTLAPVLKIFDAESRITDMGKSEQKPGASLQLTIAPAPNSTLYLQLSGYAGSAGKYTLRVKSLKAFDGYEPNDDIFNARRISFGAPLDAGIMDSNDTDYFSFVSPRTGTVNILIINRSTSLVPALSTFFADMRSSGFGPDIKTPGANLRHAMNVAANQVYFLQVWSQAGTSGKYSLLVE